jgi:hypothetical protein
VTPVNWYISSFQQEAGPVYASIFMQRQQGDIDFDTYKTTFAHVELLQKFRSQSTATHVQACRHQSTNPLLYKRWSVWRGNTKKTRYWHKPKRSPKMAKISRNHLVLVAFFLLCFVSTCARGKLISMSDNRSLYN